MLTQTSAPQETKEKHEFYDCFDLIKELVKLSPHRFIEEADLKQQMFIASECSICAQYILNLFTGTENIFKNFSNLAVKYHKIKLPNAMSETEFYGKFKDFAKKNIDNSFANKIAQELLSFSKNPEHVLFYVVMDDGSHVFIVEKFNDGKESFFRIYQSWHELYSLGEWLGVDLWRCKAKFDSQIFNEFGYGKKLNGDQLLMFIEKMCLEIKDRLENLVFYVRKFDIEPNRLKHLKELLEVQKKKQLENASAKKAAIFYSI
jgi:hypothetical protein